MCWEPSTGLRGALGRPSGHSAARVNPGPCACPPRHSVVSAPSGPGPQGSLEGPGGQENGPVPERPPHTSPGPTHTPKHHTLAKTPRHKQVRASWTRSRGNKMAVVPPPEILLGYRGPPQDLAPPSHPPFGGVLVCTEGRVPGPQLPHSPKSSPDSFFHTKGACSPQPRPGGGRASGTL